MKNKTVFVQYIQDMYRFFKLSRLKDEFGDIFSYKLDVHNTDSFGQIVSDNKVVRNIAEFYFESEHYQDAVSIYDQLLQKGVNEPEVYEKLGYAYQKMEQYDDALTKAPIKRELFDSNRVRNLKQIGYCLRKLGRSSEAITYYRDAERLASEDVRKLP
ncbi:MAG: tetratricopeptide repeat protein [Bacteroidales bacterium]|nr:tetratricopeptide repeat protein [Bacteroidales bacterium]